LQKSDVGPNKLLIVLEEKERKRVTSIASLFTSVIDHHVNISYVTTRAPPTGDSPRQHEHRRQRSDNGAEHCVERPVVRGHFGLIRPHSAVATCVRNLEHVSTVNGERKLLASSVSFSAAQLLLLLLLLLMVLMLMYSYGCGARRRLAIDARN